MAPEKSKFPVLFGAIVWDMIGGPYEFKSKNTHDLNFSMFVPKGNYKYDFTDDSILTVAVALALKQSYGKGSEEIRKAVTAELKKFGKQYRGGFRGGYGGTFNKWVRLEGTKSVEEEFPSADGNGGFKSWGNGSAMRVSSVGFMCSSLAQTLEVAKQTALPSHSHPVAINGAQAIAAAVYLARAGVSKADIKVYLETKFDLDLDKTLDEHSKYIQDELKEQSEGCKVGAEMAIRAFLEGSSFEDCGRRAIAAGGDSDTIGAMAGGIAGAYYGMSEWFQTECEKRLDDTMLKGVKEFQDFVDSIDTEPDMEEIETAIARARLEKYVLEEYKKGRRIIPKDDPKFLDLLAEMEATRLIYAEVKDALRGDIKASRQIVENNRDAWMRELKDQFRKSPELLDVYNKMEACPMKMEPVTDTDARVRYKNVPKSIPDEWPHVIHEMIPDNIVKDRSAVHSLLSDKIKKAIEYNTLAAEGDNTRDEFEKYTIVGRKTERYYKAVAEGMLSEEKMGACFDLNDLPKELKNVKDYLLRKDTATMDKFDALYELQALSEKLNKKMMDDDSRKLVQQVQYVNRLMSAVDDAIDAPKDPTVDIHDTLYHKLETRAEEAGLALKGYMNTDSKAFELAKRAQESLKKMMDATADGYSSQNEDKALLDLAKGNDYAAVFLHQNIQKYTEIAKLDPDAEGNAQKRGAIEEAKAYLQNFEKQDLNVSLDQVKKDEAFRIFEKGLNIFKLEKAMREPGGMLAAHREILEEEYKHVRDFKSMFTVKEGDNRQYSLKDYKAGIKAIESMTIKYPKDPVMLKVCGEAAEALLNHVATKDDQIKDFKRSKALVNDEKTSKTIQDIIKKGALAARRLNKAEQPKTEQKGIHTGEKQNQKKDKDPSLA